MKKNKIEHYSDKEALEFHNSNKSGKIEIISSKPMTSKRDLALAYSPGVAAPVKAINPEATGTVMDASTGQANTTAPIVDKTAQVSNIRTAKDNTQSHIDSDAELARALQNANDDEYNNTTVSLSVHTLIILSFPLDLPPII